MRVFHMRVFVCERKTKIYIGVQATKLRCVRFATSDIGCYFLIVVPLRTMTTAEAFVYSCRLWAEVFVSCRLRAMAFSNDNVEHYLVLRGVPRDVIFGRVVAFERGNVIFELDDPKLRSGRTFNRFGFAAAD